jgi:3-oxoacyl-[acyl-carrier protein] reductase
MSKLEGKVAIVTGASKGIGAGIARRLAEGGAAVVVNYASSKAGADRVVADIARDGGRAIAVQGNVANPADIDRLFVETKQAFGRLDILVNNAATGGFGDVDSLTVEDFDHVVATNLRSVFVATQEALRHMNDGGRVVSIGSIFADRMPFPMGTMYSMTKAGVAGFTRALARELGSRSITVNNVQPGPVDTDGNPRDGQFSALMTQLTPMGRYATPEEITGLVAYLAGPESSFVTGTTINIDGGFAA